MRWFKNKADFLLYSNIFVAFCVVALCRSSELLLNLQSNTFNLFVFFATLFTYNFQRLIRTDVQGELSHRQQWYKEHKKWLWFITIVSAFAVVYLSFSLSIESMALLIPLGVIALVYPLPTISLNGKILRLREVPGIKIFLIALVWTLVTVGLLVQEHQLAWTTDVWLLFFHRFCFVFAITIPFDIRDLKYDQLQLKTIPGIFGEKKARYIALAVLALYELLIIIQFFFGKLINLSALIALLGTSLVTAYLLIRSNSDKEEYYFAFWVEGASLLMFGFLMIAQLFF